MSEEMKFYIVGGDELAIKRVKSARFVSPVKEESPVAVTARLARSNRLSLDTKVPASAVVVRGDEEKFEEFANYRDIETTRSVFTDRDGLEIILTNDILVKFKPDVGYDDRVKLLEKLNCVVLDPRGHVWKVRVRDLEEDAPLDISNKLWEDKHVEFAEPDALQRAQWADVTPPSDPRFKNQWHLHNTGQGGGKTNADVSALGAWEYTWGSSGVKVVVHDSGVDINHPDLRGNMLPGWDVDNDDTNASNNNGPHGTACAGVVAATVGKKTGVVGIAPRCSIVPLRAAGSHSWSTWADTFKWARKKGDIITCSWTISSNSTLSDAIKDAVKKGRGGKGTPIFFATGNGYKDYIGYPAKLDQVIAVGASTNKDVRSGYSNFGDGIDFVAPSSGGTRGIETTDIQGSFGYNTQDGISGNYCQAADSSAFGGTSSATPLAAGVSALMVSVNPALTADEVRHIMRSTADKIDKAAHPYETVLIGSEVQRYDWSSGWTTAEFCRIGGKTYLILLKKSNGTVHVHRMRTDGRVGTKINDFDWTSGWTQAKPFKVGTKNYLFLLKQGNGYVHIHKMNSNGTVGSEVQRYDWTGGWSTAEFYQTGGKTYLFLLKKSNGSVHIHRMNSNGTVGTRVETHDWSSGWSQAQPYKVGNKLFLFLLKEGNGIVHIHEIKTNGTVGSEVERHDWSAGWSTVEFYNVGSSTYLFLLKKGNGLVHVHRMNSDGSVGTHLEERDWTSGWTQAQPYEVDGRHFMFLLKEGNGHVHIHRFREYGWNEWYGYGRVNAQKAVKAAKDKIVEGRVGNMVKDYDWSSGWTTVEFHAAGASRFLFLLKESNGIVHIHKMKGDGTVGPKVDTRDWSSGWTQAKPFRVGSNHYFFLLKKGNGHVHIHKSPSSGKVGTEVKRYDWSSGWTTAEFYNIGSSTYLFLLKEGNGIVHIHKMNSNGTVGTKIDERDWTGGWTQAQPYVVGNKHFLFLLKKGNGIVHIHKLGSNGKVGAEVERHDWSSGWSTAEFYQSGANTYLFLLKKSNGIVHIHKMNSDGSVGMRIDTRDWSSGWTQAQPFKIGSKLFLFLLKEGNGIVHIHEIF